MGTKHSPTCYLGLLLSSTCRAKKPSELRSWKVPLFSFTKEILTLGLSFFLLCTSCLSWLILIPLPRTSPGCGPGSGRHSDGSVLRVHGGSSSRTLQSSLLWAPCSHSCQLGTTQSFSPTGPAVLSRNNCPQAHQPPHRAAFLFHVDTAPHGTTVLRAISLFPELPSSTQRDTVPCGLVAGVCCPCLLYFENSFLLLPESSIFMSGFRKT